MGCFCFGENTFLLIFLVLVIGIPTVILLSAKDVKEFEKLYKQNVVVTTFKELFTDVDFDLENGISYDAIASTNMMRMGDRFYSNDYVKAKYKNVNFEMSDVEIEEEYEDSDGDTHYTTIFKGQWYIFDFNKNFKADIQVCEKSFRNSKRGGLLSIFSKDKLKKVELEDVDFNKKFKVYAKNEIDAFYVLTPNTIEKIKNVNEKIRGDLLFLFYR